MFSTKRNIQQLTSLMLKSGIKDVVVCPGSRNAPLIHNFNSAGLRCHEMTDERSAGFIALGMAEATRTPVAVCCTSGSAVLNFSPAVAEAYYRGVPLMVITADRPQRWIGQMDGQTLHQDNAFGKLVHVSVDLPEPEWDDSDNANRETAWHCNRLINEALISLKRDCGPVHVNIRISEPMFDFSMQRLPDERIVRWTTMSDTEETEELFSELSASKRPMIIMGQLTAENATLCKPLIKALAERGFVIIAEHLSNLTADDEVVSNADAILSSYPNHELLLPDWVLMAGGHIVSKKLKQLLRNTPPKSVWNVDERGELHDLFCSCTTLLQMQIQEALSHILAHIITPDDAFAQHWKQLNEETCRTTTETDSNEFTDLNVLRVFMNKFTGYENIFVGNSSMVRNLQRLPAMKGCTYSCNRGVNGIEGSVSAAVGAAISGKRTLLLIGDLSFFYDCNGLMSQELAGNMKESSNTEPEGYLRILLINNGCGKIFHTLPGLSASPYLDKYIAASHSRTAKHIAEDAGMDYYCATNIDELHKGCLDLMKTRKKCAILEVKTKK